MIKSYINKIKANITIYSTQKTSNILVIDDLYSTGATLNETCKTLRKDSNVKNIYCLAMTKTKG